MPNKNKRKKRKSFKLQRVISYNTIYAQMRKISPIVADILKSDLEARDDDNILYRAVWKQQGNKEKHTVRKFLYRLIMGKYASSDTIGRARRRLQEKNPSLRGKLYKQRHEAENEVRNQMKLPFNFLI